MGPRNPNYRVTNFAKDRSHDFKSKKPCLKKQMTCSLFMQYGYGASMSYFIFFL